MQNAFKRRQASENYISRINQSVGLIVTQFGLIRGDPEQVKQACTQLRQYLQKPLPNQFSLLIQPLFPLLQKHAGVISQHLFDLLEAVIQTVKNPEILIIPLLLARDHGLAMRALDLILKLNEEKHCEIKRPLIKFFAEQIKSGHSLFAEPLALNKLEKIVIHLFPAGITKKENPLERLFLQEKDSDIQNLIARLLANKHVSPRMAITAALLGKKAAVFLYPYLSFTHASFSDLLLLKQISAKSSHLLSDLREAEKDIGKTLLRQVIAKIGWSGLNEGFVQKAYSYLIIDHSPPFILQGNEVLIFDRYQRTKEFSDFNFVITYGGQPVSLNKKVKKQDPITRFRTYNLNHAELLTFFLDVNPLTIQKVNFILKQMKKIVEDFVFLFQSYDDECTVLPSIYENIKVKILKELTTTSMSPQLSANLTRLIQAFEDPQTLGQVHTLHGLKRYLHQKGLNLGFRLVEAGNSPNQSISLVVIKNKEIQAIANKIRFTDFEPETKTGVLPYPVQLLVDGFALQFFQGQIQFPFANIFCYGNEVHYYFSFRNHPAFLRIDYSPPLRGGMIDLEYYGVSNYDLNLHPNISLDAIRFLFQRLEFDIQIDGTRIHARYDKERSLDLEDLCQKAAYILRLTPYLMDLDWTIGSLSLGADARMVLTRAWADFFYRWGWLPVNQVLTKDRRHILMGHIQTPTGRQEISWDGTEDYKDLFANLSSKDFLEQLKNISGQSGFTTDDLSEETEIQNTGQIVLEKIFLKPLREAVLSDKLNIPGKDSICPPQKQVLRYTAPEYFAEMMDQGYSHIIKSMQMASLVRVLERFLSFTTIGTLNGYQVQSARLPLRGESVSIFALRGDNEIIRLGFFIHGSVLYKCRDKISAKWYSTANCDATALHNLLRLNNYIDVNFSIKSEADITEAEELCLKIKTSTLEDDKAPLPGERVITGLKASPGRCVGRILIGTEGRNPLDLKGAILLAASIRPQDTTYLYHAAGIISTGGGILSHAGLIAMQFRKPAMIVHGHWHYKGQKERILIFKSLQYTIEQKKVKSSRICIRKNIQLTEHQLQEGDLVNLDASAGTIHVLGQNRDALALNEGFQLYATVNNQLTSATFEKEILILRGKRLRARQHIENVLQKCTDPVITRYALYEILVGESVTGTESSLRDKSYLLRLLLANSNVGKETCLYAREILNKLSCSTLENYNGAKRNLPVSSFLPEILSFRLGCYNIYNLYLGVYDLLNESGIRLQEKISIALSEIDNLARKQILQVRKKLLQQTQSNQKKKSINVLLRHLLRQIIRIDRLLKPADKDEKSLDQLNKLLSTHDEGVLETYKNNFILHHENCGFELARIIGWKAANLAETARLCSVNFMPPWFVVTDRAFREVLCSKPNLPVSGFEFVNERDVSLQRIIERLVERKDFSNLQKAKYIRLVWDQIELDQAVSQQIISAFNQITSHQEAMDNVEKPSEKIYVALRSSSCEEDTESAARAGEFETYLYIGDEDSLIIYLKRTWSGLWTERAIHNRQIFSTGADQTGGGVIIQRMVNSRVSGVLQTVNVARGNLREMVINAGLGLGEGIVSGIVSADQIIVSKDCDLENGPLKFNYVTSDKTEQIIFNKHAGFGTVRSQTLYHQRLRPALEYVELYELVRIAARLEKAYGYPLDIEFGIEGDRLWILQVRPVASALSVYNETLIRLPFKIIDSFPANGRKKKRSDQHDSKGRLSPVS